MDIKEIEKTIIKNFKKTIWVKFIAAVKEYKLINDGDKIMVCISGGKDSILMAKCIQELQRHGKFDFEAEYVVMDPGYSKANLDIIEQNAIALQIPFIYFNTPIFESVAEMDTRSPCYMCARMRRGYLYDKAEQLGCNKIALGHHFDDVIETILLSMLYGGEIKTMMPKLHSTNFSGLELIRPMYLVKEASIIEWQTHNDLKFINCACKFVEDSENENTVSKRKEMKQLIKKFRQTDSHIEKNIFKSVHNVNLDAIIGYKNNKQKYDFLDNYDL